MEHKHFPIHQGACSYMSLGSHPGSGQAALAPGPCVPVCLKPLGWFRRVGIALRIGKGWDGEGLLCHFTDKPLRPREEFCGCEVFPGMHVCLSVICWFLGSLAVWDAVCFPLL